MQDRPRTAEVSHFDDAFPDEDIFGFEVTMEDSFDTHDYEGLDELFEYP